MNVNEMKVLLASIKTNRGETSFADIIGEIVEIHTSEFSPEIPYNVFLRGVSHYFDDGKEVEEPYFLYSHIDETNWVLKSDSTKEKFLIIAK